MARLVSISLSQSLAGLEKVLHFSNRINSDVTGGVDKQNLSQFIRIKLQLQVFRWSCDNTIKR